MSEASPVTGEESERGASRRTRSATDERWVLVELEHGRWNHAGWALFGLVLGALLIWKLGVVGKGVGVALVAFGAFHGFRFARTLLHPAGAIKVTDSEVQLPRGLCRKGHLTISIDRVTHAFFLRRSVPWLTTGPVLVIEAEGVTHIFPRDWFASDADQRRVAHALNKRLGRLP